MRPEITSEQLAPHARALIATVPRNNLMNPTVNLLCGRAFLCSPEHRSDLGMVVLERKVERSLASALQ